MFTNLIESQSHGQEFRRRGRFLLATATVYAFLFFAAGIASIYAYDARLEAQNTEMIIEMWVPPVRPIADPPRNLAAQAPRRNSPSNAPVDPHITIAERTAHVSSVNDTRVAPPVIGTTGANIPQAEGTVRYTGRNVNPPNIGDLGCITCRGNGTGSVIPVDDTTTPPPVVVKPPQTTQRLTSTVLVSKALSLPQPPYPPLAIQIKASGPVNVQILVDETGRVISAHAVSGNAFLTKSAEEAAHRARFTPTVLNGQAVKVQGVITYNFVLQ